MAGMGYPKPIAILRSQVPPPILFSNETVLRSVDASVIDLHHSL